MNSANNGRKELKQTGERSWLHQRSDGKVVEIVVPVRAPAFAIEEPRVFQTRSGRVKLPGRILNIRNPEDRAVVDAVRAGDRAKAAKKAARQ